MDTKQMKQQLLDRLESNYDEYRADLLLYDRQELIDKAGHIADTANAYNFLKERSYTEQELSYLLKFQNPLDVVVDHWIDYTLSMDTLDDLVAEMADRQDDLSDYPLIADAPTRKPERMRQFLNVNLADSLKQIALQTAPAGHSSLDTVLMSMARDVRDKGPEDAKRIFAFSASGIDWMRERELLVGDSRGFRTLQAYHSLNIQPDVVCSVEVTQAKGDQLFGNLYMLDYHQLEVLSQRYAMPITTVELTLDNGRVLQIPEAEYSYEKEKSVAAEYGSRVLNTEYKVEDESVISSVLHMEQKRREKLPKGQFSVFIDMLENRRIQAEVRRVLAAVEQAGAGGKNGVVVEVSDGFAALSTGRNYGQLINWLGLTHPEMKVTEQNAANGKLALVCRVEQSAELAGPKPSIREQLAAAKDAQADRPASHKHQKDKDAR